MAYRGVKYNTTALPVSDASINVNRNSITVDSLSSVGTSAVFGGRYVVTGSFGGGLRKTAFANPMASMFGTRLPSVGMGELKTSNTDYIMVSDEFGSGITAGPIVINSMEITLNAKEYAKVTFNYIGIFATGGTETDATEPDYSEQLPVFYNATVNSISTTGITIKIERPIDQDYFIMGSEFLQEFVQSGPVTVTGTINLASTEWNKFSEATGYGSPKDTITPSTANTNPVGSGSIVVTMNKPDGSGVAATITIDKAIFSEVSASASGRNRFEKTLNWTAEINNTNTIKIT